MTPDEVSVQVALAALERVPGTWNDPVRFDRGYSGQAVATYHLTVFGVPKGEMLALRFDAVGTAFRLWINGVEQRGAGKVAATKRDYRPSTPRVEVPFVAPAEQLEIVVQIANFDDRNGGFWSNVWLGTEHDVRRMGLWRMALALVQFGAFIAMGTYHLVMFFNRRSDRAALWFGVFSVFIALRALTTGERLAFELAGEAAWQWALRLDYLSFYLAVPACLSFLHALFPEETPSRLARWTWELAALFGPLILLAPPLTFTSTLPFYQALTLMVAVLVNWYSVRAIGHGRPLAWFVLLGTLPLGLGALNDVMAAYQRSPTGFDNLAGVGLLALLLAMAALLATRLAGSFLHAEELGKRFALASAANARFVPTRLLGLMGHTDAADVELGEHVDRDLTVLVVDFRSCLAKSQAKDAGTVFERVEVVLSRTRRGLLEHRGVLGSVGHGFAWGLFADEPGDAMDSALEILREVRAQNAERASRGAAPLRVGVAVHTGKVVLGALGDVKHLDIAVLSDVTAAATNLLDLARKLHTSLLVTRECLQQAQLRRRYNHRTLGALVECETEASLEVVEVLDALSEDAAGRRDGTRGYFEVGVDALRRGERRAAAEAFTQVLALDPGDGPATYLLHLAEAELAGSSPPS